MDIDTAHQKMKENDDKEPQKQHEGEDDYESYDSEDSITSSQSGCKKLIPVYIYICILYQSIVNVVFEVNKVDETYEEGEEFDEKDDEETDSPDSSQSEGTVMQYEFQGLSHFLYIFLSLISEYVI